MTDFPHTEAVAMAVLARMREGGYSPNDLAMAAAEAMVEAVRGEE